MSRAGDICREAAALGLGERAVQHGDKAENHANIARLWNAYLEIEPPLTPRNVAIMMVLLKAARTKTGGHNLDDYVDMAGYAAIAGELAEKEEA